MNAQKHLSSAESMAPLKHFSKSEIDARVAALLPGEHRPAKLNSARFSIRHSGTKEHVGSTNDPEEALKLARQADEEMDLLQNSSAGYRSNPGKLASAKLLIFDNETRRHIDAAQLEKICQGHECYTSFQTRSCAACDTSETPRQPVGKKVVLTEHDREVLVALASGLHPGVIARQLGISESTLAGRKAKIYRKLNVNNRVCAARYAVEYGLIPAIPAEASAANVVQDNRIAIKASGPDLSAILARLESIEQTMALALARIEKLEKRAPVEPVFGILMGESTPVGLASYA